jgi:hypothetical protein
MTKRMYKVTIHTLCTRSPPGESLGEASPLPPPTLALVLPLPVRGLLVVALPGLLVPPLPLLVGRPLPGLLKLLPSLSSAMLGCVAIAVGVPGAFAVSVIDLALYQRY